MTFSFHPATASWFASNFDGPTEPQKCGWPAIQAGGHCLIAAPTGSGKTLAAFLAVIDRLVQQWCDGDLGRQTRIVYVSPLKALSNDIHRNLAEPLKGIRAQAEALGYGDLQLTTAVRTGDTSPSERQAIVRRPPHILVTTPESLYLMLTAQSGRAALETVETVIVDEIHALAGNRRGAHLALSLERLAHLCGGVQRIGLSATQKPMDTVARFLTGVDAHGQNACTIVDEGHLRQLDLGIVMPGSPLEAVMSHEVWEEIYEQLTDLIQEHKTTLIFTNTRRLAERLTLHLAKTVGAEHIASHHGSLSMETRHTTEARLKSGDLKAVVATASLELGLDIGYVDLVCQIGATRTISQFLQRIGRSGHYLGGVPKGRIFPLTRDELVEAAALVGSVHRGELDKLVIHHQPMDVLAQQLVAETACEDYSLDEIFAMFRRAYVFKDLTRERLLETVHMLAEGYQTKRGRGGALIYYDGVNQIIKGRKGARLTALTNGGAIPDNADYRVLLEPSGHFVGTLNEDFAIESLAGDVFQLGNKSWRIVKIETGKVRVEDAEGMPPNIPFWFGEAPSRSAELSAAVADLRADVDRLWDQPQPLQDHLHRHWHLEPGIALAVTAYLGAARKALGCLPSQETLVMERFFDESGGMQLVIHAPFGSRLNRAWGLALRKRFCRSFNFELQAAANEDAVVLSLGPKHAFPIEDVFRYLHPNTAKDVLIQALLDAPMFQTRWRWNAGRALALRRMSGGRHIPPQIQRMVSEDLIAMIFPDSLACLENIQGEREVPNHPLVNQTIEDCLYEAMDLNGLLDLLEKLQAGKLETRGLDLPEPSVLAHGILTAKPYAFLDNAPLEERRTQAVYLRRTLDMETIRDQGLLDQEAVETVRTQAMPRPAVLEEVHEALIFLGCVDEREIPEPEAVWKDALPRLFAAGRAGEFSLADGRRRIIAAERLPLWRALFSDGVVAPELTVPAREASMTWDKASAAIELIRMRMELCGPTNQAQLAAWFCLEDAEVEAALIALEAEGAVMRGFFDKELDQGEGLQWCDRRLLARIHQLTLKGLRNRIKPTSIRDYMRFLFRWQGIAEPATEESGLEGVVEYLEGFEAAASAWESDLLPARVKGFKPAWLDRLCLTGLVSWGRLQSPDRGSKHGPIKTSPTSLFFRENGDAHLSPEPRERELKGYAAQVHEVLAEQGALFFAQLQAASGLLPTQLEVALGELVSLGLVTADSISGLRALLVPTQKRPPIRGRYRRRGIDTTPDVASAGRWSLLPRPQTLLWQEDDEALEQLARTYLRRWGVVTRRTLVRESNPPPWRELLRIYRRLESIGEIRGGYFVDGTSGEQFALPEAVGLLRKLRDGELDGKKFIISACDPLNLVGILVMGKRVPNQLGNRILYQDGEALAALIAGEVVRLKADCPMSDGELMRALEVRRTKPKRPVHAFR